MSPSKSVSQSVSQSQWGRWIHQQCTKSTFDYGHLYLLLNDTMWQLLDQDIRLTCIWTVSQSISQWVKMTDAGEVAVTVWLKSININNLIASLDVLLMMLIASGETKDVHRAVKLGEEKVRNSRPYCMDFDEPSFYRNRILADILTVTELFRIVCVRVCCVCTIRWNTTGNIDYMPQRNSMWRQRTLNRYLTWHLYTPLITDYPFRACHASQWSTWWGHSSHEAPD